MLYKLCLSSTFRDSTCHMEGVTIFKVNLNLGVYMYYINHSEEVYMANILPETEVRGSLQ